VTHPTHVCFFAPAAWPVLTRDMTIESVGGAEVQQVLLARQFVRRGFRVSMVCGDFGQPDRVEVDGITVFKYSLGASRIPMLRFFHPRLTNVWRVLDRIDPDIVYQRTAAALTGVAALYAWWNGRRFVYAAACDLDVNRRQAGRLFRRRGGWRSRQLFTFGLRLADAIVCQHARQAHECRRSFGREAIVIPSCHATPDGMVAAARGYVLWAGTLAAVKRPRLFLDLARSLPHVRFRMVGGPSSEPGGLALFDEIRERARSIENLEFGGFVPYARIDAEFDGARLFVNTSEFEGFPNTFLQAWARGIPTVSFCTTESTFEGAPVATAVSDLDQMAAAVQDLMRDDVRWKREGARARRYAMSVHAVEVAVTAYERLFDSLAGSRAARSPLAEGEQAPHRA
jgi:glycosyltransferase involved in cell wall biosynthesis